MNSALQSINKMGVSQMIRNTPLMNGELSLYCFVHVRLLYVPLYVPMPPPSPVYLEDKSP